MNAFIGSHSGDVLCVEGGGNDYKYLQHRVWEYTLRCGGYRGQCWF